MKKKIILFLSFLLTAMLLTGCNEQKVRADTIDKMTQIANNVIHQKDYVVPDDYDILDDKTTSDNIIMVRTTTGESHIQAVYEVSETEVKLLEIITASAIVTIVLAVICIFLIGVAIAYGTYAVIKALTKSKKE